MIKKLPMPASRAEDRRRNRMPSPNRPAGAQVVPTRSSYLQRLLWLWCAARP